MMSGTASDQFVSYDLGNTASPAGDRDLLGWGNSVWDPLPWGTYGFSSLRMGRDRYAEYAAQRLAAAALTNWCPVTCSRVIRRPATSSWSRC
ncbi:hypothetical protein BZL30_9387 [Mycobacterium kansasii]|uniref:Uncharacterized protein n=1 Tax=Mycobacterium kansasii TaxID=1768 RepID=A0A1V3W9X3_MYCKA|nr:hypothetical protein BZL30_9387 [Mycobacterium kansasii]